MTYHITNASELQAMNADLAGTYILDNDINLAGVSWVVVGNPVTPFVGTFDGQNHTIRNLSFTFTGGATYGYGLFGFAGAKYGISATALLKNVILENFIISTDREGNGALLGSAYSVVVENCHAINPTITGWGYCGGLIGELFQYDDYSTILSSISGCSVVGGEIYGEQKVGGLCGSAFSWDGYTIVENSFSSADVTATSTDGSGMHIGGFIGQMVDCIASNCYATGDVLYTDDNAADVGGFAGSFASVASTTLTPETSGCYATGTVTVTGDAPLWVGGFIGYAAKTVFLGCYSTGEVYSPDLSSTYVGGFVGSLDNYYGGSVTDCYSSSNVTVNGGEYIGGLFGYISGRNTSVKDVTNSHYSGSVDAREATLNYGDSVGGLAGYAYAIKFSNCYSSGTVGGDDYVGGFVGYLDNLTEILRCYSVSNVTGVGSYSGSFLGYSYKSLVHICYSSGNVMGTSEVGGFAGGIDYPNVHDCYSTANVTGQFDVGGFVGWPYSTGTISNCYSEGTVTAEVVTVGDPPDHMNSIGGFAGYAASTTTNFINCYSVGIITAPPLEFGTPGGFIGYVVNAIITGNMIVNCAWFTSSTANAIGWRTILNVPVATLSEISSGTDEPDNTLFYNVILKSPSHVVYDQGNANAWDFATPIWYEWSDRYPLFVPEVEPTVSTNAYAFIT